MQLMDLITAATILCKYAKYLNQDYVANSFPNGTPKNPSQLYLVVEVSWENPVSDEDAKILRSLGWHSLGRSLGSTHLVSYL